MTEGYQPIRTLNGELAWSPGFTDLKIFTDKPAPFSPANRAEIDGKVLRAIKENQLDGLIALSADHFTYLTGTVLPFAEQQFDRYFAIILTSTPGKNCIIVPPDWALAVKEQNWNGKIHTYSAHDGGNFSAFIQAVTGELTNLNLDKQKVGLEIMSRPEAQVNAIQTAAPNVSWVEADTILQNLRLIKTEAEIRLIEIAARNADRAFVSALNHMEGNVHDPLNYDLWEFTERIRVHVGEFGGSGTGNVHAQQGHDAQVYYKTPRGTFIPGSMVRAEASDHFFGYWASNGRTFVIGVPCDAQTEAYNKNIVLKRTAVENLKPGVPCSQVFHEVKKTAEREKIGYWQAAGFGHGVGTSEREAPYLTSDDDTVLQPGMVLMVSIYTYGPQQELIVSKDTYAITETGSRLLSWYRNWDELYSVYGDTARHG